MTCLFQILLDQEREALVAELTDVVQRQRAKIGALARERAELAARPAADPAQLEALRAEAAALQDRLRSFTVAKARPAPVILAHHICWNDRLPRGCLKRCLVHA